MNHKFLTIVTCTYNRASFLLRVFESLNNQTTYNFQWLIIDDGSTDNTEAVISNFKSPKFDIEYHKKINGGKHTAINYSMSFVKSELVLFLDSDDLLTNDAMEVIYEDWQQYSSQKNIAGISYMKTTPEGKNLSKMLPNDFFISDYISYRINHSIKGDQCEVVRAELIKKYPFPVIPNEKFFSEGWLWFKIAEHYQMIYRSKSIYIAEYLIGGLTKSGKRLSMSSPIGSMINCRLYLQPGISLKEKIKKSILFDVYSLCVPKYYLNNLISSNNMLLCIVMIPCSLVLYFLWSRGEK